MALVIRVFSGQSNPVFSGGKPDLSHFVGLSPKKMLLLEELTLRTAYSDYELPPGGSLRIGRYHRGSRSPDVELPDIAVSRRHGTFREERGVISYEDTGSNGTYIDGRWIHHCTEILKIGAALLVGGIPGKVMGITLMLLKTESAFPIDTAVDPRFLTDPSIQKTELL